MRKPIYHLLAEKEKHNRIKIWKHTFENIFLVTPHRKDYLATVEDLNHVPDHLLVLMFLKAKMLLGNKLELVDFEEKFSKIVVDKK